jgi:putative aminopeptidase FrvX
MQPDSDLLDALRTDLAELTALHAPSGAEQVVIARLRELFAPLVDVVSIDPMGNLTATRQGLRMSWSRPMLMRSGRS